MISESGVFEMAYISNIHHALCTTQAACVRAAGGCELWLAVQVEFSVDDVRANQCGGARESRVISRATSK